VALAVKLAEPGDCVVIAGKGHENYQIIGRTKVPMDDRDLAREGLKQR
jgi:UDP-N-acetylmuramoyl-L-alanyl-D-glutamate--2,6-diaminopimelate ligase